MKFTRILPVLLALMALLGSFPAVGQAPSTYRMEFVRAGQVKLAEHGLVTVILKVTPLTDDFGSMSI